MNTYITISIATYVNPLNLGVCTAMNVTGIQSTCIKAEQFFIGHHEFETTILSMFRKDSYIDDAKLCLLMRSICLNQLKDGHYYLVKFNDQCGIEVYYTKVLNTNKITPSDLIWKDMANGETISKIFSSAQAIQFFIEENDTVVSNTTTGDENHTVSFGDIDLVVNA